MTETRQKLIALSLVTFTLMSVLSGGATFAVLSDSYIVTANLSPAGNVNVAPDPVNVASNPVNVGSTPTPTPTPSKNSSPEACGIGDTPHSGDPSNAGEISIVLEPTDQSIGVNNSTTYDVRVEGASENITSYHLEFALCDPSVATFENFTHTQKDGYTLRSNKAVEEGNISASAGVGTEIQGPDPDLGTITVSGNSSGETRLGIANVTANNVNVKYQQSNGNYTNYDITNISIAKVKVNESKSTT